MEFKLKRKDHPHLERYFKADVDKAHRFAELLKKELGEFIKAVVIFGSTARMTKKPGGDIDVLVVLDDTQVVLNAELTESYRIIVKKLIGIVSTKLHIVTLKFSAFWEYVRSGDPVAINILRDGVSLYDSGFFDPIQLLLKKGRIRPSKESVWTYYSRAPHTLYNSQTHVAQAILDLYWAVIDSAHAALMHADQVPPSPDHVADLLESTLVKKKLLERKYVLVMRRFYRIMKLITHRHITSISGKEYDGYFKEAKMFVERMRKFIDSYHPEKHK